MIKPICSWCGEELVEFGAILFAPPENIEDFSSFVEKFHMCRNCFKKIKPSRQ